MTAKVVEPEVQLSLLFSGGVCDADDDHVDTVWVADKLVVRH